MRARPSIVGSQAAIDVWLKSAVSRIDSEWARKIRSQLDWKLLDDGDIWFPRRRIVAPYPYTPDDLIDRLLAHSEQLQGMINADREDLALELVWNLMAESDQ